jgi:adenosylcobyric acid synthase
MFLGTGSDVGKSVLAAGFCRILLRRGYRTAPFKAQNMALNSFVTMQGEEMGRAQVMQAQAAGILPSADMNPVLLKPSGQSETQVIVQGRVTGTVSAGAYYRMKSSILPRVMESYHRLSSSYQAIVLEGAGSTSEINLRRGDFVNIELAGRVGAPVVLVADIDRGGVFASIVGTMKLLKPRERRLVLGFIINKFRGDPALFERGVRLIRRKTGRPVFGVLPYFTDIHLPQEDSVALQAGRKGTVRRGASVRVAVVRLPYISNYTDFDPLELEEDTSLCYTTEPEELSEFTVAVLPGTKNTIQDLLWLKERGFDRALRGHVAAGRTLVGICGGYQMLGARIQDPYGVESPVREAEGLGLMDTCTVLDRHKTLNRAEGYCRMEGLTATPVNGYEIHMGITTRHDAVQHAFSLRREADPHAPYHPDGAVCPGKPVWGTYLHGLFEGDLFRRRFLEREGRKSGRPLEYRAFVQAQYDRLADLIERNIDVDALLAAARRFQR